MRSDLAKSLFRTPVILLALSGWLVAASFLVWADPFWEAVAIGQSGWSMPVADAVYWLHVLAFAACCALSTERSVVNLVRGEPLLPNVTSLVLSLPGLIAVVYGSWFLINLPPYSVRVYLPSN